MLCLLFRRYAKTRRRLLRSATAAADLAGHATAITHIHHAAPGRTIVCTCAGKFSDKARGAVRLKRRVGGPINANTLGVTFVMDSLFGRLLRDHRCLIVSRRGKSRCNERKRDRGGEDGQTKPVWHTRTYFVDILSRITPLREASFTPSARPLARPPVFQCGRYRTSPPFALSRRRAPRSGEHVPVIRRIRRRAPPE